MTKIWIDGDACPKVVKEIIFRAADKRQIETIIVANKSQRIPWSNFIRLHIVGAGLDVADHYIVEQCEEGDLVITADIPLASLLVEKQVEALNPRGELYDAANIGERLSVRDFMDQVRGAGITTGGPPTFSEKDKRQFASAFDRWLAKSMKS